MEKALFVYYPKCGTCRKAEKWLKEHGVDYESRHIVDNRPTAEELKEWITRSGIPVRKFFNTSGQAYRTGNVKELVATATDEQLIDLLATNGMLVKRPVLVTPSKVLAGFKEEEWTALL